MQHIKFSYEMKKKKISCNHEFVESYLRSKGNKKEMGRFVDSLKKMGDYNNVSSLIVHLKKLDSQVFYHFFGNLWPKDIQSLGKCNESFFYPNSIENEIEWMVYQIKKNKEKLRKLIKIRESIEHDILLGKYAEASNTLYCIPKEYGYSIWYYEMFFLVYCLQEKRKDALNLISEINKKKQGAKSGFVPFLLHYLLQRSQKNVSAYDYDMVLDNLYKRNVTPFQKDRLRYFLFRLNYFHSISYADNKSTLMMESTNALIDRYIMTVNLLKALFVKNPLQRSGYVEYARILYSITDDKVWLPFMAFEGDKMPSIYYDERFVNIIDCYYIGEYEKVCKSCKDFLYDNPGNFDVIKFYCRSLVFLNKKFAPICRENDCIVDKIGETIHSIMLGEKREENLYNLYKLNKNIYGLSIASFLDTYIKEEKAETFQHELSIISQCVYDPYMIKIIQDERQKIQYLQEGIVNCPSSIVLVYQLNKLRSKTVKDERIVDYIRNVDKALISFDQKDYHACIGTMNEIIKTNKECIPIIQTAVKYIFDCYCELDEDEYAVQHYVSWLVSNEASISKINTKEIVKKLKSKRYRGIKYSIELLIFVLRNAYQQTDKSYIVETFLKYQRLKSIKQLVDYSKSLPLQKQEIFLYLLTTDEFFNHTILVDSSKAILENKQYIIQRLIELNTEKKKMYEEISQLILQQMIVYEGIEKMDDSKIYANIPAIVKYEMDNAQRLYEQFKVQMQLTRNNTVFVFFDAIKDRENLEGEESLGKNFTFTDYALKEISHQLFMSVCTPYLKSKFGLGSYLSARIRHGVIDGQLQAGFIEHNILLQTENGKFIENIYWKREFGLSQDIDETLHLALTKFTKNVNTEIQDFKDNVLQIRIKSEDKGMFNYRLDDDEICIKILQAYNTSSDFESFCYSLMAILQNITEDSLGNIRQFVRENLTSKFRNFLDQLLSDCPNTKNENFNTSFRECVNDAQRDIQNRIQKVESWFHIANTKLEDFNLYDHILAMWNITSSVFPSVNCDLMQSDNADSLKTLIISGQYFNHLGDIFRIFFTNMIKYSKKEYCRRFIFKHSVDNNILCLHFENNYDGNADLMNEKFSNLLQSYDRLQKEGGSGLVKARKIVKYDLKCIDNEVVIKVVDGKCVAKVYINLEHILKK